eukprot:6457436-Amphidinium_carterae.1
MPVLAGASLRQGWWQSIHKRWLSSCSGESSFHCSLSDAYPSDVAFSALLTSKRWAWTQSLMVTGCGVQISTDDSDHIITVEHVTIYVTTSGHEARGELEITLTSPAGGLSSR